MKFNFSQLKNEFEKTGYVIFKNLFDKDFINILIQEINNSKSTIKYFDKNNILRRIEQLYNKGKNLNSLNEKILLILEKIYGEKFLIFKDKFNAKPPGGEGFFAHYDGVFHFKDENNNIKNGWYEYGEVFINALVALDECNNKNGTIEIAKIHEGNFSDLLKKTKKDGTPAIIDEIERNISFETINLNVGDMVIFSNRCPHRSQKNYSKKNRRILYYTYSLSKNGSKYDQYFEDKQKSKNLSKALEKK